MININSIILDFRVFLNTSWPSIKKFINGSVNDEWLSAWLQANFEMIVEAECNSLTDSVVILDYYGEGTEGLDWFLPENIEGQPRVSLVGVKPSHTIVCLPKVGNSAAHSITGELIYFPRGGFVFGQLMGMKNNLLGIVPNFEHVELDDESSPNFSYIAVSDVDFMLVEINDERKK
jgi:hypothetical protein